MKRSLLSISLLLSAGSVFAQVHTLTTASMPSPGDAYTTVNLDTLGVIAEGAGQIWNFANVTVNGAPTTMNYVSPGATPYAVTFPGATVSCDVGGGTYSYFKTTASEYSLLGVKNVNTVSTFTDPPEFFTFPFTYGSVNSDTQVGTSVTAGNTSNRTGSSTTTGIGSGTLIMPGGSFTDVLLVKIVQNTSDQALGIAANGSQTTYSWFHAGYKQPILEIISTFSQFVIAGNPQPVSHSKSMQAYVYAVGIEPEVNFAASMNILPNPAVNETYVSYDLASKADVLVSVVNTLGQVVHTAVFGNSQPGQHKEAINIEKVEPGVYFLTVQYDGFSATRKLVVQ